MTSGYYTKTRSDVMRDLKPKSMSLGDLPCVMSGGIHSPGLGQAANHPHWVDSSPCHGKLLLPGGWCFCGAVELNLADPSVPGQVDFCAAKHSQGQLQHGQCSLCTIAQRCSIAAKPLQLGRLQVQDMDGHRDCLRDDGKREAQRCSPCLSSGSTTVFPIKHASRSRSAHWSSLYNSMCG